MPCPPKTAGNHVPILDAAIDQPKDAKEGTWPLCSLKMKSVNIYFPL